MNTLYKMKQGSVVDASLAEIAEIAENSVKKYLHNMRRVAVAAENSVKSFKDMERFDVVAKNIAEGSMEKTDHIDIVTNATKELVAENGLFLSHIKKTAEDCLRNFLQKNLTQQNYIESSIDTNQNSGTENIIEPTTDIIDSNYGISVSNIDNDGVENENIINNGIVKESESNVNNDGISVSNISNEASDDYKIVNDGLILSHVKKTAEDCLRNFLQKNLDITSTKNKVPMIGTNQNSRIENIIEPMTDIIDSNDGPLSTASNINNDGPLSTASNINNDGLSTASNINNDGLSTASNINEDGLLSAASNINEDGLLSAASNINEDGLSAQNINNDGISAQNINNDGISAQNINNDGISASNINNEASDDYDKIVNDGLILLNIKKTAEDCLRNFLQKNLDITSMKNKVPIIDTYQNSRTENNIEPMTDIIDSNDGLSALNINNDGISTASNKDGSSALNNDGALNVNKDGPSASNVNKDGLFTASNKDGSSALNNDGALNVNKDGLSTASNKDGALNSNKDGPSASNINNDGISASNINNDDGISASNIMDDGLSTTSNINKDGLSITSNINKDGLSTTSNINKDGLSTTSNINKDGLSAASNNDGSASELAKSAEESVRKVIEKMPSSIGNDLNETGSLLESKQDIRNRKKQGKSELFVSPDTNSQVSNNDKGIDTTNTTKFDSNMSSLPPLQVTKSNDNKNTDENLVTSVIGKSDIDNNLNEIMESAVNAIRNFLVNNNDTPKQTMINDITNNEFDSGNKIPLGDDKKIDKDKINSDRNKAFVYPVEKTLPDASITLYDVNHNDPNIKNMIKKTNLRIDPNDTSKFIIL